MSNSRRLRRGLKASRRKAAAERMARPGRWKEGGPSAGTVRRWLKTAEEAGVAERAGTERTGRPGRPAQLWQLTPAYRPPGYQVGRASDGKGAH